MKIETHENQITVLLIRMKLNSIITPSFTSGSIMIVKRLKKNKVAFGLRRLVIKPILMASNRLIFRSGYSDVIGIEVRFEKIEEIPR